MEEFSEKELENWCIRHFTEFAEAIYHEDMIFLGAQVPCAYGIIDMLAAWHHIPIVIELKARVAKPKDVAQLHRYCRAVEDELENLMIDRLFAMDMQDSCRTYIAPVAGYLIAPEFDDSTMLAMQTLGLAFTVAQSGSDFMFYERNVPGGKKQPRLTQLLRPLAEHGVGREVGQLMKQEWLKIRKA